MNAPTEESLLIWKYTTDPLQPVGEQLVTLDDTNASTVRAGAAGTAGTVLAVSLLSHLTISRRGLHSRGRVAPTWWRSIDECSSCM